MSIIANEMALDIATWKLRIANRNLGLREARFLRGAIAGLQTRPEFHHHKEDGLVYQHPLVRYDTSYGVPRIVGIGVGAMLLKSLQIPDSIKLGNTEVAVSGTSLDTERVLVGSQQRQFKYELASPLLPLNQANDRKWRVASVPERQALLNRVVIGNILSFCKVIGLHVSERLVAKTDFSPAGTFVLKPGVRMRGFRGSFEVNFALPEFWGLGKSSSRGFGTITRKEGAS